MIHNKCGNRHRKKDRDAEGVSQFKGSQIPISRKVKEYVVNDIVDRHLLLLRSDLTSWGLVNRPGSCRIRMSCLTYRSIGDG